MFNMMVSTCRQPDSLEKRLGFRTERETETMAETGYMCRRQENTLKGEHLVLRTNQSGQKKALLYDKGFLPICAVICTIMERVTIMVDRIFLVFVTHLVYFRPFLNV